MISSIKKCDHGTKEKNTERTQKSRMSLALSLWRL